MYWSDKMKIAFITAGVLPIPSVDGGAVENLVEYFLKNNENTGEHEITVYSIYSDRAFQRSKEYKFTKFVFIKIPTYQIKIDKITDKFINKFLKKSVLPNYFLRYILKNLSKEDYDRVVVENRPHFGIHLRKHIQSRLILHLHNNSLNKDIQESKRILDCFDEIYAVSEFIKKCVMTIEETDKVKVLYNGIDTEMFKKYNTSHKKNEFRKIYNIKENDLVILYSGRVIREKGVKELIQAFNQIKNNKNIKLLIIGSPIYGKTIYDSYYEELKEIITMNKENIIFTGYIDYNKLPEIYNLASFGVVPSLCEEAATLTTVEMLAMELPVIISDSGGIHELVNKDCAFIIRRGSTFIDDLSKNMDYLIQNPKLIKDISSYSRKQAEKFDISVYCNDFNSLLKESKIIYEK